MKPATMRIGEFFLLLRCVARATSTDAPPRWLQEGAANDTVPPSPSPTTLGTETPWPTSAWTPYPTEAPECNESTSCPAGKYCDYRRENLGGGYCRDCEDGPPNYYSCPSWISSLGLESCMNTCYLDYMCSTDSPCPDGRFCSFQLGESGLCLSCDDIAFDYPTYCNDRLPFPGNEECKSQCFKPCSQESECTGGSFCTFENDAGGYCMDCTGMSGDPKRCLPERFYYNFTDLGQAGCLSQCFEPCSAEDSTCSNETFCELLEGGSGYCAQCSYEYLDPGDCFSWLEDETSAVHCAESCFGTCSNDNSCSENSFCNFQFGEDGYCWPCTSSLWESLDCMQFDRTGQESCVATCFDQCSSNMTCPQTPYNDAFCDFQLGTSGGCLPCWKITDGPEACITHKSTDGGTLNEAGTDSCNSTCFSPCDPLDYTSSSCPEGYYCNYEGFCRLEDSPSDSSSGWVLFAGSTFQFAAFALLHLFILEWY